MVVAKQLTLLAIIAFIAILLLLIWCWMNGKIGSERKEKFNLPQYQLYGTVIDDIPRVLDKRVPDDKSNFQEPETAVNMCGQLAQELGYNTFGIEWAGECWVGNRDTASLPRPITDTTCNADNITNFLNYSCPWKLLVYKINPTVAATTTTTSGDITTTTLGAIPATTLGAASDATTTTLGAIPFTTLGAASDATATTLGAIPANTLGAASDATTTTLGAASDATATTLGAIPATTLGAIPFTTLGAASDATTTTLGAIPAPTLPTLPTLGATHITDSSGIGSIPTSSLPTMPNMTMPVIPTANPALLTDLINKGLGVDLLTREGIALNNTYRGPSTNIVQTNFSGTSNIYSPFLYYNKGSTEKFIGKLRNI